MSRLRPAPLIRSFETIADRWTLERRQRLALLGITSASTWAKWRREPERVTLHPHVLERLSHVFAIFAYLEPAYGQGEAADGWVHRPSSAPLLAGRAPIDLMTSGWVGDLARVRLWLQRQSLG